MSAEHNLTKLPIEIIEFNQIHIIVFLLSESIEWKLNITRFDCVRLNKIISAIEFYD